jgi:RNA-directed DNA polymerase
MIILVKLGIEDTVAWKFANTRKGYRRISNSLILSTTFTNEKLNRLGYVSHGLKQIYKGQEKQNGQ